LKAEVSIISPLSGWIASVVNFGQSDSPSEGEGVYRLTVSDVDSDSKTCLPNLMLLAL